MKMNRKVLSLLSLCQRAGAMITGDESVEMAMKSGESRLVIVAEDASENTRQKFINKADYYKVPIFVMGSREELSHAIGKFNRTVFTIKDANFANKIKSELEQ